MRNIRPRVAIDVDRQDDPPKSRQRLSARSVAPRCFAIEEIGQLHRYLRSGAGQCGIYGEPRAPAVHNSATSAVVAIEADVRRSGLSHTRRRQAPSPRQRPLSSERRRMPRSSRPSARLHRPAWTDDIYGFREAGPRVQGTRRSRSGGADQRRSRDGRARVSMPQ